MPSSGGIFYVQHGRPGHEPPVVLIHGAGGTHLHWPPEIRRLSGRRVIALDLPGHGRSAAPGRTSIHGYAAALLRFLDALHLERVVLIGHSMGSAIALTCALDYPARVWGLALLGAAARLPVSLRISEALSTRETIPTAIDLVVKYSYSSTAADRLMELAAARLASGDPVVLRADFEACNRFDVTARLGELRLPTLILAGGEDHMTPPTEGCRLHDAILGSRLEQIPGAGHMMMLERPAALARALDRFLEDLTRLETGMASLAARD